MIKIPEQKIPPRSGTYPPDSIGEAITSKFASQDEDEQTAESYGTRNRKRPPLKLDFKKKSLKRGIERTSLYRLGVQTLFAFISFAIGWQFYRFVVAAKTTASGPLPSRPPGVEGYLPISGLMGAIDWIYQGTLNTIHPAATILFLLLVLLSLLFRKSFCGWICPVGFLSEWLARAGRSLFGRNFRLPKWLDIALRSIKYLLLGFFVWAIFSMGARELHAFIASPYNKISDVKMLEFFLNLSVLGGSVILVLAILSIFIHSFWCRYVCPYGALMGLVSWISPLKIRRNETTCTDCGICDKVCPARLPVSSKPSITSVECIGCTDCVSSCPVKGTLTMGTKRRSWSPKSIAVSIIALFIVGYVFANSLDMWHNEISDDEVRFHIRNMNSSEYGHPGMSKGE